MSISNAWVMQMNVTETLDTNVDAATVPVVTHDGFSSSGVGNETNAVPETDVVADTYSLSGGALTVDLTALVGTNNLAKDATGKKIQHIRILNKAGNAAMTFVQGAADDYELLGATFSFTLLAGQEAMFNLNEAAPDVGATDKTIDVSGTDTDQFEMILTYG